MPMPCEIAVKSVIPAIRAHIAKELVQTYRMKQTDVADVLGITQTAVSKYISNVRGQAIQIDHTEEIQSMMNDVASQITSEKISRSELVLKFCSICKAVRSNGLMCKLCETSNRDLDIRHCIICKTREP